MGGGGGGGTTVVTRTKVVQPTPPPPSPVVTAGKVSGTPSPQIIGSTIISSPPPEQPLGVSNSNKIPAWLTVPNVFFLVPPASVTAISTPTGVNAKRKIDDALDFQMRTCNDITSEPNAETVVFEVTGNGGATRFRFKTRGAPTNVQVYNVTEEASISDNNYSVDVRGSSFSWLVFNNAPADGDIIRIAYQTGDSGIIQNIPTVSWNNWRSDLSEVERLLRRIRDVTEINGSTWNTRSTQAEWRIDDPTVINDALNATRNLRSSLGIPGAQLNIDRVRSQCENLNRLLMRIDRRIELAPSGRSEPSSSVKFAESQSTASTDTPNRIYNNDIRFVYFQNDSTRSGFFNYMPPNKQVGNVIKLWTRRIESLTGRIYYEQAGYREV